MNKYIYGHISQETAYVVNDYPWGFRLRTTIRYWIESKKNYGQRFCSQTINPKTGRWCAPKYSTYHEIMVMYLDENEHVKVSCINLYTSGEKIEEFNRIHLDKLDEFQKDNLKMLIARDNIMKNVTFTIKARAPVSLFSQKPEDIEARANLMREQEEKEKEQTIIRKKISRAIQYEYQNMEL